MVITVKRSEWYRGKGGAVHGSALLRTDGQKCCIGFMCLQAGILAEAVRGETTVEGLRYKMQVPSVLKVTRFCDAYKINDDRNLSDAERERKLNEWAAEHGHSFVFVD